MKSSVRTFLIAAAIASAASLPAQESPRSAPGHFEFTVDTQVVFARGGSPTPRYPEILRAAGVAGELIVQMVIDTTGLPMAGTLRVVRKSHDLFEASFRTVLPELRFLPARVGERKVRQLVQLAYRFGFEGELPRPLPSLSPEVRSFLIPVIAPGSGAQPAKATTPLDDTR